MLKDKIDQKIIEYLKENSRESSVDIGKKLKLSESAVRRRVKNLVEFVTFLFDRGRARKSTRRIRHLAVVSQFDNDVVARPLRSNSR